MNKPYLECRIHYEEDWEGRGEYYVFETKWSDEKEWGLDTAFKLLDYRGEDGTVHEQDKGAVISYQALTKIRELMRMGCKIRFGK